MLQLKKIWKYISFQGIDAKFPHPDTKRIILTNQLCVFVFLVSVPLSAISYFWGYLEIALVDLITNVLYMVPILLNAYRFYTASRMFLYLFIVFNVFVLASTFGREAEIHFSCLFLIVFPLIIFKLEQIFVILTCILITTIACMTLFLTNFSLFALSPAPPAEFISAIAIAWKTIDLISIPILVYSLMMVSTQTEKMLDQSNTFLQNQLHAIFDNSQDALFVLDWQGEGVLKANQRAADMFEMNSNQDFHQLFDPNINKSPYGEELATILNGLIKKGSWTGEVLYKSQKGREFWGDTSMYVIKVGSENYQSIRITDITEKKKVEQHITTSLREKEVLLAEIHHRVKNNMAIISGMLTIQSTHLNDQKSIEMMEEMKRRIYSMAMIHDKLYQTHSFDKIEYAGYITGMVSNVRSSYSSFGNNIYFHVDCESIFLDIKKAIPCGLILNELLVNVFKHAFKGKEKEKGEVRIRFFAQKDKIHLEISDNGVGFDYHEISNSTGGLGLHLVQDLVRQISGKLLVDTTQGSRFTIVF